MGRMLCAYSSITVGRSPGRGRREMWAWAWGKEKGGRETKIGKERREGREGREKTRRLDILT